VREHQVLTEYPARKSVIAISRHVRPFPVKLVPYHDPDTGEMCLAMPSAPPSPSQINPNPAYLPSWSYTIEVDMTHVPLDGLCFSCDGRDNFLRESYWSPYAIYHKFTICGESFSVPQLFVLARTVHTHCYENHQLRYQRYWYAEVMYNTLKMVLDRGSAPGFTAYTDNPPLLKPGLKVGTVKLSSGVIETVTTPDPEVHETMYNQYLRDWADEKHIMDERMR
jgi:hypothetical protein